MCIAILDFDNMEEITEEQINEVMGVIDLDRLIKLAQRIKAVKEHKHGEVSLVIKNGEIVYIETRISESAKKK